MGKSASKLKKKRSQSIAWSFRFPSLGSLSRPRRMAPPAPPPPALLANSRPHLDVRQWLAVLDLTQYGPNFDRFSGVEELLSFSEEDIRSLGIRNSAHRARVVSSIVALRDKYEKDLFAAIETTSTAAASSSVSSALVLTASHAAAASATAAAAKVAMLPANVLTDPQFSGVTSRNRRCKGGGGSCYRPKWERTWTNAYEVILQSKILSSPFLFR